MQVEARVKSGAAGPQVDLRYVQCWWQDREPTRGFHSPGLVPELLVKDPTLVQVVRSVEGAWQDFYNVVRQPVIDASELLPIDLPPDTTQQYWLTVRVPSDCKTKRFRIIVKLIVRLETEWISWKKVIRLPVTIDVMPFELAPSPIIYSCYYRAALHSAGPLHRITPCDQYAAELRTMVDHGITHPTCWDDMTQLMLDERGVEQFHDIMRLRDACGVNNDPFFVQVTGLGMYKSGYNPDYIPKLKKTLHTLRQITSNIFKIQDLYVYGFDEPNVEQLTAQVPAWDIAREMGCKVYGALNIPEAPAIAGGHVDLALTCLEAFNAANVAEWHDLDAKVGHYGPTTSERADLYYRRRYGLKALRVGFDVVMPYAHNHSFGKLYDDLDHPYKDHMVTLPVAGGERPIETVQIEAIREAKTDVQLAATLEALGGEVPNEEGRDLDEVRAEIIGRILTLSTR